MKNIKIPIIILTIFIIIIVFLVVLPSSNDDNKQTKEKKINYEKITVNDINSMSKKQLKKISNEDTYEMNNKVYSAYLDKLYPTNDIKNESVNESNPNYYNDENLNQQVHKSMERSMQLLNNLREKDLESYEVETKVYKNNNQKPDINITLNLKGNNNYDQELLQQFEDRVSSNFQVVDTEFHGYFKDLTIEFNKEYNAIGEVTLDLEEKDETGSSNITKKVKIY
ncbi:hypothetical protein [Staphylococcus equorum]|uniref:hypothetical protein n=1 Tax=Staphylococcus equorum TaxID=246432 RepID=UPI0021BE2D0C|nr:hypothetical protein [Staphylococcus equorum]MEB7721805.1 hypothetical protein [Staphylococcus equorum]